MPPKSYYCDCEHYCHGQRTKVSYSTYHRHAPHRDLLAAIPQTLVATHSGPAAVTPAISTAVAPTGTVARPSNQAALSLALPTPTNIKVCLAPKGSALTPPSLILYVCQGYLTPGVVWLLQDGQQFGSSAPRRPAGAAHFCQLSRLIPSATDKHQQRLACHSSDVASASPQHHRWSHLPP